MAMRIDALLTLAQWFSPAFPVGAFAYSHGLETEIEAGHIRTAQALQGWISDILQHGSGRNDALLLAAAWRAETPEALCDVNDIARAFAPSRERLMETDLQGAAFGQHVAAIWPEAVQPGAEALAYPVAAGAAARGAGLELRPVAAMYLQAFAATLASVGMRLIPLGQTEGQGVITAVAPLCAKIADDTACGDLERLAATTFAADIASMRHETLYSRSFRT